MLWVALISICLVFLVLVLLVWVMKLFGYVFTRRQAAATAAANKSAVVPGQIHDEEIAAIATALKLYRSALAPTSHQYNIELIFDASRPCCTLYE